MAGFATSVLAGASSALDASVWHHYVESWDQSSGARAIYLDGVQLSSQSAAGTGATFLDASAYMYIGGNWRALPRSCL